MQCSIYQAQEQRLASTRAATIKHKSSRELALTFSASSSISSTVATSAATAWAGSRCATRDAAAHSRDVYWPAHHAGLPAPAGPPAGSACKHILALHHFNPRRLRRCLTRQVGLLAGHELKQLAAQRVLRVRCPLLIPQPGRTGLGAVGIGSVWWVRKGAWGSWR